MPQVDIDIDDDFHHEYAAPPQAHRNQQRRSHKATTHDREIAPRSNQSTSTSHSHSTSSRSNYNAHSVNGDDEEDEDEDGDEYAGDEYQRSLQKASSFNVEQMIQMRESHGSFRDSLAPQQRPTEMGNALMRMDDGYRHQQGNRSTSGSFSQQMIPATTADGLTPLLQAARSGDLMLLNALIIQPGTDILRRDPVFGQTALHFAIRGGHLGVVQALLMPQLAGSIVNVADSRRNTALHLAAAKSRRMTKILLESGADVNFLNMRNQTPLGVHILTVTRDDPTLTETLLQYRANPDAPVDKSTTLHVALDKGLYQIAARLVRHGARLDLKDEAGKMVFDKVDHTILKMLLSKVAFPPVWVPDTDRDDCMECHKKFGSVGSRRHHCRFCGRLLCSACASCQIKGSQLPFQPRGKKKKAEAAKKKQRVCATCFEITAETAQAGGRTNSRTSSRRP